MVVTVSQNQRQMKGVATTMGMLEQAAKQSNDVEQQEQERMVMVEEEEEEEVEEVEVTEGAIVVGAGPSGLACAACLHREGVPVVVLEREHCIAPLWQHKTYDRLKLHIDKNFCQLPHMPFPESYPRFVTRQQFLYYLNAYSRDLRGHLRLGHGVERASFCRASARWHVLCRLLPREREGEGESESHGVLRHCRYVARWLVVATGENADVVWPAIPGLESFRGSVLHSSQYKCGLDFLGLRVLVVGCGNSGMEIALDLSESHALPSIVVRSPVHVLPREMLGASTYSVAMKLLKILPMRVVDALLLLYARMVLGNTASCGLPRPTEGPLLIKAKSGRTPVLDVGTVAKIRKGQISVLPAIKQVTPTGALFQDGRAHDFDVMILATGYRSDVTRWLKDDGGYFTEKGLPKQWKAEGNMGLYAAGMSQRGLHGSAMDAQLIAHDISGAYRALHHHRHQ